MRKLLHVLAVVVTFSPGALEAAETWLQSLQGPFLKATTTPTGDLCAGGAIVDDGTYEDGFGVPIISIGTESILVQRLVPTSYPAQLTKACVCWRVSGSGGGHLAYDIVALADGPIPGELVGSVSTDSGTLLGGATTFVGTSCVPMNAVINSGGIYVGMRAVRSNNVDFFTCGDTSTSTPLADMFSSTNGGNSWTRFSQTWHQIRAIGVRATFEAPEPPDDPEPPAVPGLTSPSLPGFRFWVRISDSRIGSAASTPCPAETICVAGAIPTRAEIFVRIVGPKPNGYLWPNVIKFNTTKSEVWIQQASTGIVKYYVLPALAQDSETLPGLVDKTGFLP